MEKHHIEVMLPEEKVDARIREIGEQISREYAGKSVHLICILKGSVYFTCELAKKNYCTGNHGFHAVFQLWRRHQVQWDCSYCQRSG